MGGRQSSATHTLSFLATLPPMNWVIYGLTRVEEINLEKHPRNFVPMALDTKEEEVSSHGGRTLFYLPEVNEFLLEDDESGARFNFQAELRYYKGMRGSSEDAESRASGAYIFRPDGALSYPMGNVTAKIVRGRQDGEVQMSYPGGFASLVVRLGLSGEVEVDWQVGPIPVEDGVGKEVVVVYKTEIQSNTTFFTDSNGRQFVERKRGERPSYDIDPTEPVAQNYYPVTSMITISDDEQQFGVVTDRAQGGSSLEDGSLELMVHRRLLDDDHFGVGEALDETQYGMGLVARGKHLLVINQDKAEFNKALR